MAKELVATYFCDYCWPDERTSAKLVEVGIVVTTGGGALLGDGAPQEVAGRRLLACPRHYREAVRPIQKLLRTAGEPLDGIGETATPSTTLADQAAASKAANGTPPPKTQAPKRSRRKRQPPIKRRTDINTADDATYVCPWDRASFGPSNVLDAKVQTCTEGPLHDRAAMRSHLQQKHGISIGAAERDHGQLVTLRPALISLAHKYQCRIEGCDQGPGGATAGFPDAFRRSVHEGKTHKKAAA